MTTVSSGLPIRKKLMLAMVITGTVALLITSLVFTLYIVDFLRRDVQNEMMVHAQRTGASCIFSLSFEDQRDAQNILKGLEVVDGFESVAIYRPDGTLFAEHIRPGGFVMPNRQNLPRKGGVQIVSEPIMSGTEQLGSISIAYNLSRFYGALYRSITVLGIGIGVAMVIALVIGRFFQRTISNPVEILSATARRIAETANYNLRVEVMAEDEIGQLAHNFNDMLAEVQSRDRKLSENQARFRTLVDDAVDIILLIRENGTLIDCNPMAEKMLQLTKSELLNKDISSVIPTLSSESFQQLYHSDFSGNHPMINASMVRKNGEEFPTEIKLGKISHEQEKLLMASCRDITERVAAENKLRITEENLRQSQKMDSIGQLAGGIAHDFNNMLTGIIGASEMIRMAPDRSEDCKRFSELILSSARKAAQLTKKLLTFSRKTNLVYTPLDINKTVRDTVAMLERSINPLVEIHVECDPNAQFISGDEALVQNVILNLMINARDAIEGKGELRISTGSTLLTQEQCQKIPFDLEPKRYVFVQVSDTGIGMSPRVQKEIFNPFFTTKDIGKGTGMGLSSAYGAMKEHHGAILVDSEKGKGSTFTVYFPAMDYVPVAEVTESSSKNLAAKDQRTILIVDDEPFVRTVLSAMLSRIGCRCISAESGMEGIEKYREHQSEIDLVILDMLMPQMSGAECFAVLKKINPDILVIIASGYAQDASPNALMQEGVKAFFKKPFELQELKSTIQDVLDDHARAG